MIMITQQRGNLRTRGAVALWSKIGKNTDKIAIQLLTVPRVSGASEQANGRTSGPVLQFVFMAVQDHSAWVAPSNLTKGVASDRNNWAVIWSGVSCSDLVSDFLACQTGQKAMRQRGGILLSIMKSHLSINRCILLLAVDTGQTSRQISRFRFLVALIRLQPQ